MSNLLVELLVEELPPKALKKLGASFADILAASLKAQGLRADKSHVTHFATPRRLAAHITDIAAKAADQPVTKKLMPVNIGLDANNKPTPALLKKLASLSLNESAIKNLQTKNDGKTESLFLDTVQIGVTLKTGLQKALEETLAKLPIPKVMTYQINDNQASVNFIRPAHSLIALHDDAIVPVNILGLSASNTTKGHRFVSHKDTITINNANSYAEQLKQEGAVMASFEQRRANIAAQIKAAADKENLVAIDDDELLDEVTALVELPNVLLGQYKDAFLVVPQECLILTMKSNQKYFPLLDHNKKLTNKFLIVSNINPSDPSAIIGGNERVVNPRLADAKFFYDQDRKTTLKNRADDLNKIVYHNKLGSQGDRRERVTQIASEIAKELGDDCFVEKVEEAARLSKADLTTNMVGEFPALQGIMGRYYAQHDGLDDEVALAIEEHYKPRFAGDELPRNKVGTIVALADKLETLVGLFGINEQPTGDKDPFALRRNALGMIRILMEEKINLSLNKLIGWSMDIFVDEREYNTDNAAEFGFNIANLEPFISKRLAVSLRDQDSSPQEVDAVLSDPSILHKLPKRLEAVRAFSQLPEAKDLAAANKRISNIMIKENHSIMATDFKENSLREPAEIALKDKFTTVKNEADQLFESGDYKASLQALAVLKEPINAFFDNVMVNADNPKLKTNRLSLLAALYQTMNRVARLSKLAIN